MIFRCKNLIVTGGNGYIGSSLIRFALRAGINVVVLGRKPIEIGDKLHFVRWKLGEGLPEKALSLISDPATTGVIHLAHDWHDISDLNIIGTSILFKSSRGLGVPRFVFASSQSSRFDAPNRYGRIKWKAEEIIKGPGVISARIGLVYGFRGGMYGLLLRLVKLPILPMVCPKTLVQPIHIDVLVSTLIKLLEFSESGYIGVASDRPVEFAKFLKRMAKIELGRRVYVIPIPLKLALFGCNLINLLPILPAVDKERILGLAGTMTMKISDNVRSLSPNFIEKNLPCHSSTSTGYKSLFIEGNFIYRYFFGVAPAKSELIKYVRNINKYYDNNVPSIAINPIFLKWPSLFRFAELLSSNIKLHNRTRIAQVIWANLIWSKYFKEKTTIVSKAIKLAPIIFIDILIIQVKFFAKLFYK